MSLSLGDTGNHKVYNSFETANTLWGNSNFLTNISTICLAIRWPPALNDSRAGETTGALLRTGLRGGEPVSSRGVKMGDKVIISNDKILIFALKL